MKLAATAALLVSLIGSSTAALADVGPYDAGPHRAAPGGGAMHAALVARFDRDGDGRLDHGERRRAAKALRRMASRLARGERRPQRVTRAPQPGDPRVDVDVRWDGEPPR